VADQLKSGVTRACRYEPETHCTYEELAQHYETTVLPARPLRPRDEAKVEVAVQIAQRWLPAQGDGGREPHRVLGRRVGLLR
jgi:transposase